MTRLKFLSMFVFAPMLLEPAIALAGDSKLYKAPPPDDAAFIRWLDPNPQTAILGISPEKVSDSSFRPVSAAATNGAEIGAFYSALRDANGQQIIVREPDRPERSKVHLILVNASDSPVRVTLAGKDVEVIGTTDINDAASRPVNPVKADLVVERDNGEVLGTFPISLRRGQNVTFIARADKAELIENQFGPNISME